jgi:monomeric isocitrate dehydrogenase
MVSRQDLRDVNEQSSEFQAALDEMQELAEQAANSNVTVDNAAYADAHERVKAAVTELWTVVDDAVDRTDVYEPDDSEQSTVTLPNAAAERASEAVNKPKNPGNN